MNCKSCGGSMSPSQKLIRGRTTTVYECNQDNGQCLNAKGYPTSIFANNGAPRVASVAAVAPPPRFPSNAGTTTAHFSDGGQAWGNAKNAAAQLMSGAGAGSFDEFIALARKIYAAKAVADAPTQHAQEPEPEEAQVY